MFSLLCLGLSFRSVVGFHIHLSLSCCQESISLFWCHAFRANLPNLLGSESEQEHSWDIFKIGPTAPHKKADRFSSFHCAIANEVKELKNSDGLGKEDT